MSTSLNPTSWTSFCRLLGLNQKMLKSDLLDIIFPTSGAKARKCQIELPGPYFVDFWGQGQKMLKSDLLDIVLSTYGAKARKNLNQISWTSFCRFPRSRPENVFFGSVGHHQSSNLRVQKADSLPPLLVLLGGNPNTCSSRFRPADKQGSMRHIRHQRRELNLCMKLPNEHKRETC